jgi:colanic acid/amylovoran biosynthesis glycosyltransferase
MIKLAASPQLAAKLGSAARAHMISDYDIKLRIALLDRVIQDSISNKKQ